jgi:hypothetical protein
VCCAVHTAVYSYGTVCCPVHTAVYSYGTVCCPVHTAVYSYGTVCCAVHTAVHSYGTVYCAVHTAVAALLCVGEVKNLKFYNIRLYRMHFVGLYCTLNAIVPGGTCLSVFNPINAELNPICHLLALLVAHHILHVSRIRVNMMN